MITKTPSTTFLALCDQPSTKKVIIPTFDRKSYNFSKKQWTGPPPPYWNFVPYMRRQLEPLLAFCYFVKKLKLCIVIRHSSKKGPIETFVNDNSCPISHCFSCTMCRTWTLDFSRHLWEKDRNETKFRLSYQFLNNRPLKIKIFEELRLLQATFSINFRRNSVFILS